VGSEMCIRDSQYRHEPGPARAGPLHDAMQAKPKFPLLGGNKHGSCPKNGFHNRSSVLVGVNDWFFAPVCLGGVSMHSANACPPGCGNVMQLGGSPSGQAQRRNPHPSRSHRELVPHSPRVTSLRSVTNRGLSQRVWPCRFILYRAISHASPEFARRLAGPQSSSSPKFARKNAPAHFSFWTGWQGGCAGRANASARCARRCPDTIALRPRPDSKTAPCA